jgi:hypothetical protein
MWFHIEIVSDCNRYFKINLSFSKIEAIVAIVLGYGLINNQFILYLGLLLNNYLYLHSNYNWFHGVRLGRKRVGGATAQHYPRRDGLRK